jgi:hypothetical protein
VIAAGDELVLDVKSTFWTGATDVAANLTNFQRLDSTTLPVGLFLIPMQVKVGLDTRDRQTCRQAGRPVEVKLGREPRNTRAKQKVRRDQCPNLHVKLDQLHPIGFSDA